MEAKQTSNVFVIDGVKRTIVERHGVDNPKEFAEQLAKGYWGTSDRMKLEHKHIPTTNYPNRYGIETPVDFFIHYLSNQ